MSLKPEISIPVAATVATFVVGMYNVALPTIADARVTEPNNQLDAARKTALWTSATMVSGIAILAKDPTIFIIGGATVVAMDWWHRHGNEVDPASGLASERMKKFWGHGPEGIEDQEAGYVGDMADQAV